MFGHQDDDQPKNNQTNNSGDAFPPEDLLKDGLDDSTNPAASDNVGAPTSTPSDDSSSNNDSNVITPTPVSDEQPEPAVEPETPTEAPEEPKPAMDMPTPDFSDDSTTTSSTGSGSDDSSDDLINIKQSALQELTPLVDQLDQTPEERFRTTMMMIQAADNKALIKTAYEAAQQITDEKAKAQALLDVVNEINYFTQNQN